jgi:adenylosuccinate synthase
MEKAYIVIGLGFGDEGKGTTVNHLTQLHKATLNIRFSGGGQCLHNVIMDDGRHHTFRQIGSGSFDPTVSTLYGKYALFDPTLYEFERREFEAINGVAPMKGRYFVHEDAVVVTAYHKVISRLRELSRTKRYGSVGQGIGETRNIEINYPDLTLRVKDFVRPDGCTVVTMEELRKHLYREYESFRKSLAMSPNVLADLEVFQAKSGGAYPCAHVINEIRESLSHLTVIDDADQRDMFEEHKIAVFEGNQGVLLDQDYGFHPHNTWTTTTSHSAHKMLDDMNCMAEVYDVGVTRTFTTRHGAGPFPSESSELTKLLVDPNNAEGPWQQHFRVGQLDLVLLDYAIRVNRGINYFAVTHMDWMDIADWKPVDVHDLHQSWVETLPVFKVPHFKLQSVMTQRLFASTGCAFDPNKYKDKDIIGILEDRFKTKVKHTSNGPKPTNFRAL